MKRHTSQALSLVDDGSIQELIGIEQAKISQHNGFNSAHELYAVLLEELDEFWDGVKANDLDPLELIQVAAVAIEGVKYLANLAVTEIDVDGEATQ